VCAFVMFECMIQSGVLGAPHKVEVRPAWTGARRQLEACVHEMFDNAFGGISVVSHHRDTNAHIVLCALHLHHTHHAFNESL